MSKLLIKGGLIITPTEERMAEILIDGDKIEKIGAIESSDAENLVEIDASDCFVTPGLFDLQLNGGPECDFWEELSRDKVANLSHRLISAGVTSILPTLITGDMARLKKNRDFLRADIGMESKSGKDPLLRMPGIHFEGPCLSPRKPGVHPAEHLQPLNVAVLKELIDDSCKLMTVAAELNPDGDAIKFLQEKSVIASLGHSNATFEEAKNAFSQGINVMTHTFNALPSLHHREPGAVAAALINDQVNCCVIPDGLHVVPAMVELIFKIKGAAHTILVSDAAAIGTSQGGLVGSSLSLDQGVRNMVNWGICNFADAIRMAAYNPAKLLQLEDQIGQLKAGAFADIIIWDKETLSIKQVIFNGMQVSRSKSEKVRA